MEALSLWEFKNKQILSHVTTIIFICQSMSQSFSLWVYQWMHSAIFKAEIIYIHLLYAFFQTILVYQTFWSAKWLILVHDWCSPHSKLYEVRSQICLVHSCIPSTKNGVLVDFSFDIFVMMYVKWLHIYIWLCLMLSIVVYIQYI